MNTNDTNNANAAVSKALKRITFLTNSILNPDRVLEFALSEPSHTPARANRAPVLHEMVENLAPEQLERASLALMIWTMAMVNGDVRN